MDCDIGNLILLVGTLALVAFALWLAYKSQFVE